MEGLAYQIVDILELPEENRQELGASARRTVQARYDINNVARQYEKFYKLLAEERPIFSE